jgi:hypothetical protein
LDLSDCSSLQQLPDAIGQLAALKSLKVGDCGSLQQLPETIGRLRGLSCLYRRNCSRLQQLPDAISKLAAILDLGGCHSLQTRTPTVAFAVGSAATDRSAMQETPAQQQLHAPGSQQQQAHEQEVQLAPADLQQVEARHQQAMARYQRASAEVLHLVAEMEGQPAQQGGGGG